MSKQCVTSNVQTWILLDLTMASNSCPFTISGVVIAGFYRASDVEMMPFYALLWGLGQTIVGVVFSFTRILATL